MAAHVLMYSTGWCPYCQRAERLLRERGAQPEIIDLDAEPARRAEMMARSGRRTVPQIFVGDTHVGGCDDLVALDRDGGLVPLLGAG
jgi:glutaredoxin 3